MKKIIALFIFTTTVFAEGGSGSKTIALKNYKSNAGIAVNGKMKSEQVTSTDSTPVFKSDGSVGIKANFDFPLFLGLSINVGAFATYGSSKTEYNFKDSTNTTTKISELDSTYKYYGISPGLRFAPINTKFLTIFAGYGYTLGQMDIKYDQTDYEEKVKTTADLEKKDSAAISHPYLEAGVRVMIYKNHGIEMQASKFTVDSAKFKTLGDESLKMKTTQYAILYTKAL